jgi:hypothetical protein
MEIFMSKARKIGLIVTVVSLVAVIGLAHAQRPPETDETGTAYLRVNINPTNIPPMVNVNPYGSVPRVQVTDMPEIRVAASGCASRRNYQTGIGRAIPGPMMITYLHLPEQTRVTLADPNGSHSMNLGAAGQITTAIFLQANQRLEFDAEIMYSGCRPE